MRAKSFENMVCSLAQAVEQIGDRWAFLILRDLSLGLSRWDELSESTGISPTTLSDRLGHLSHHGLIERQPYQQNPPRYRYRLTEKGAALWPVLLGLIQWGDRWTVSRERGAPIVFDDTVSGEPVDIVAVSRDSGRRVAPEEIRASAGPGADATARHRLRHL